MTNPYWYHYDSTNSTTGYFPWGFSDTSSTTHFLYTYQIRRILVLCPESWDMKDALAFADLVNYKTRTGWAVTMVIDGQIAITDPNVEVRSMDEFLPLLRWRSSRADNAKITEFFQAHPLTAPSDEEE